MVSQTLRFTSDQPIKQWLTERKIEEDGYTKLAYLQNKNAF